MDRMRWMAGNAVPIAMFGITAAILAVFVMMCVRATNAVTADVKALADDARSKVETEARPAAERASGCPLDAVEYDPPVCMDDCWRCIRMTDRLTHESWWVLRTHNGYIVLPITEAR